MKRDYLWLVIIFVALVGGCFITAFAWNIVLGFTFKTSLIISAFMYLALTVYVAYRVIKDIIKYYYGE